MSRAELIKNTTIARLAVELVILLGVIGSAAMLIGTAMMVAPYHGDETHYLRSGRYFSHAIVHRDFGHPDWADSYETHTQPMLARYMIGASLWVHGVDPEAVPLTDDYQFHRSYEDNVALGTVPSLELLHMGRTPMIGFGVGVVGLVYVLARVVSGPFGGIAAAMFTAGSQLTMPLLVRAAPDSIMMFFLLLSLTVSIVGARRNNGGIRVSWSLLLGVSLGLALSAKLSAFLGILATLGWSVVVAALTLGLSQNRTLAGRLSLAWQGCRGWWLAVAIAIPLSMATNPHVYPAPLTHTLHLLEMPISENEIVRKEFPQWVLEPIERPGYVLRGSLVDQSLTSRLGYPVEAPLAALGASALVFQVWLQWRRNRQIGARGLIVVTVLTYYFCLATSISMTWDRYLLPTAILSAILSGVGLAWTVRGLGVIKERLEAEIQSSGPPISRSLRTGEGV